MKREANHKELSELFYVYEHWLDGKVFYVGKGKKDRAFLVGRNRLWEKFTKDKIDKIEVIIKGYFQIEEDAFDFEEHLINKYSRKGIPLTNISKNSCFMYNLKDFNLTNSIINTNLENENQTYEEVVSFEHLNNKEKLNLIIELTEEIQTKFHSIEHGVYGESPAHRILEINRKR